MTSLPHEGSTRIGSAGRSVERELTVPAPPTPLERAKRALNPAQLSNRAYLAIVLAALAGTLISLLLLNTALTKGSFDVFSLTNTRNDLLADEQRMSQELAAMESPERLAGEARRLGMIPNENPVFLLLPEGRIAGRPKSATGVLDVNAPAGAAGEPAVSPSPMSAPSASPSAPAPAEPSPVDQGIAPGTGAGEGPATRPRMSRVKPPEPSWAPSLGGQAGGQSGGEQVVGPVGQ